VEPTAQPTPRPRLGARDFPAAEAENLERLFRETEALRGLSRIGEVEKLVINRADASQYLINAIEPEDVERIRLRESVYRLVGLIPDDADLLQLRIDLLSGLVLGFYDPTEDALFIVDDIGINTVLGRRTIVHEMIHALQDQYFDLESGFKALDNHWDMTAAYTHLIEGDARLHELEFAGGITPSTCSAVIPAAPLRTIPAVIQRELESPYSNGLCFVRTVAPRLPEGVNSIFENLPTSMEQILHPQKYLEGEDPIEVELRPLTGDLGAGWREVGANTFGQFWWWNYLLLGLTDTRQVTSAGAGWGGDRWALYGHDDGSLLIHVGVVWDSPADAQEFWRAFVASLNGRAGTPRLDAANTSFSWQENGKHLRADLRGDAITMVISDNEGAVARVGGMLGLQ
jgi:hypothetical protein